MWSKVSGVILLQEIFGTYEVSEAGSESSKANAMMEALTKSENTVVVDYTDAANINSLVDHAERSRTDCEVMFIAESIDAANISYVVNHAVGSQN